MSDLGPWGAAPPVLLYQQVVYYIERATPDAAGRLIVPAGQIAGCDRPYHVGCTHDPMDYVGYASNATRALRAHPEHALHDYVITYEGATNTFVAQRD